jgi:peptide-methionine (S)-S-oxide reductase
MTEKATFAAGCFWGVESAFQSFRGVVSTQVGYTGGRKESPTYREVCSDTTGHAEAVEVEFDPTRISYEKLLDAFFSIHDPTQINRQGPDTGSQYRTAIFTHSPAQEAAAKSVKERLGLAGAFRQPIVTEIVAATRFWPAEEYHQKYEEKHGRHCDIG